MFLVDLEWIHPLPPGSQDHAKYGLWFVMLQTRKAVAGSSCKDLPNQKKQQGKRKENDDHTFFVNKTNI